VKDPARIRAKIERCRRDLARAEGQVGALKAERDEALAEAREVLGCGEGEEEDALEELRERIGADDEELEALFAGAEGKTG
jgi:hypothetical protein